MDFIPGAIDGVVIRPLHLHRDGRGWLCELFRRDELPAGFFPEMAYISVTEPGVARGPHEHREQTDCFCFLGPSPFQLRLWDNRPASPTYRRQHYLTVSADAPQLVIIPPGVVHGYRNIGTQPGMVINCPDRLYRGPGRCGPVDEIRHENDPDSPFGMSGALASRY